MGKTLFRKLAVTFLVTAGPVFLLGLLDVLDTLAKHEPGAITMSFALTTTIAIVLGAISAGLRAVLARWTDIVPGDEVHSPNAPPAVVVTSKGSRSAG